MESLQQFIVHQSTSTTPLLIINASALALVVLLSISTLVTLAGWALQRQDHGTFTDTRHYEDEDGVAIDGPNVRDPNRIPTAVHLLLVVINALLSLTKVCVFPLLDRSIEAWLQFAIAVSGPSSPFPSLSLCQH